MAAPTRYRDETGLTEKQREALPHLLTAPTILSGVRAIVDAGIISSTEYFYHSWWKEPVFVEAVSKGREELYGNVRESTLQKLIAFHHDAANAVIAGMLRQGAQQVQWARLYYDMISALTGQPMIPVPKTSIQIGMVNGVNVGDDDFPRALKDHVRARHELLAVLNAQYAVAIVAPVVVKGNGGNGGSE